MKLFSERTLLLFLFVCQLLFLSACSGGSFESNTNGVAESNEGAASLLTSLKNSSETEDSKITDPQKTSLKTCLSLGEKLRILEISDAVLIEPHGTELPEDSKFIDIYEVTEYPIKKERFLGTLVCRAKAKTTKGNYPIIFYLEAQKTTYHLVLESQGKRKWIFKWEIGKK